MAFVTFDELTFDCRVGAVVASIVPNGVFDAVTDWAVGTYDAPVISDYIVFDPNVFDWSFAIMSIIPTFNKIIMEREFQRVEAGQAVALICSIQDIITTPGQRFQFNPSLTPQVIIHNPDNTVKVGTTNMVFVSTGVYIYQHQTLSTDMIGFYTARFSAVDGSMTGITDRVVVFEVTSQ